MRVARMVGSSVRRKPIPWRTAMPRSSRKARDLVDDAGALRHQPLAHPMQRLQVQLLRGLGRHELHRRALHGFGNRFGIIEVVLLSLCYRGEHIWPASAWHRDQAIRACGSDDARRRRLPCRSGTAAYWRAALPPGHATTFAAARWRRAHRGPRRGTSSCRYRCRSRRLRYWVSGGHGVLLVLAPLASLSLAGREHGRTIPLADRHPPVGAFPAHSTI